MHFRVVVCDGRLDTNTSKVGAQSLTITLSESLRHGLVVEKLKQQQTASVLQEMSDSGPAKWCVMEIVDDQKGPPCHGSLMNIREDASPIKHDISCHEYSFLQKILQTSKKDAHPFTSFKFDIPCFLPPL